MSEEFERNLASVYSELCAELHKLVGKGANAWADVAHLYYLMKTKCLIEKELHKVSDKYEYVFEDIDEILEHTPDTWKAWMNKPGGAMSIVEMEYNEMKAAHAGMLSSPPTVSHRDFVHELKHSAAAMIYAIELMTCNK